MKDEGTKSKLSELKFDKSDPKSKKAPVKPSSRNSALEKVVPTTYSGSVKESKKHRERGGASLFRGRLDTAFGLDISDSSIELLEFKAFSHKPRAYSRVILEDGIVVRGRIIEPKKLEEKLQNLLLNTKPIKVSTNRAILSLPEENVFTWSTTIDKSISGNELKTKVFEEARKVVPLDFKKIYWDYNVYPLPEKGQQYVTFLGIDQDVLNPYIDICSKLGIEVVEFSMVSTSLARVFLPTSEKNTNAILDIGGELSTLSIFSGNRLLKLSMTVATAGDTITKALMEGLKISEIEADQMKVKFGVTDAPNPEYRKIVDRELEKLLGQVKEIINYYEKNSGEDVDAIYLTGGTSLMSGVDSYVEKSLGKKLQPLASLPFIAKSPIFKQDISLKLFANAAGNALLGISQSYDIFTIRRQVTADGPQMSLGQLVRTGYYSKYRMIFDARRTIWILLIILILALVAMFTLMWLDIRSA